MSNRSQLSIHPLRLAVMVLAALPVAVGLTYALFLWAELAQRPTTPGYVETPFTGDNPPSPDNFEPRQVVSPFPAIVDAPVATISEVQDEIDDAELVLGIAIDGEARAYPINMLTGPVREIINDQLAGHAIAATW